MINCLVVDDEPIARSGIVEHIKEIEFLHAAGECRSPLEATVFLQENPVDLIFLDIEMPKMTGIDFLKNNPSLPPVIFTTAYSEYALEGYELDVIDYLLKPIGFNRFYKAAVKAREYLDLKTPPAAAGAKPKDDYFFIKSNQKIEIADVLYVEGMANYIIVHTTQGKHIAYLTFKGIEESLPPGLFIRIHRSYLVAVSAIRSMNTDEVVLQNISLPISRNYRDDVMQLVEKRLFRR